VAATAVIFFRRFYLRTSFCRHDPMIVAPSCLYLASKTEESITVAKHLVQYIKKLRPAWPYDAKDLLDYEMVGRPLMMMRA
jgi:cyclin C